MEVDVALVGAGGAGLGILIQLDRLVQAGRAAGRDVRVPRVALLDPVHRRGTDRTWCFWDHGRSHVESAVHRAWDAVEVTDRHGRARRLDLSPLRYVMVRSTDFYALAEQAALRLGVQRVPAAVGEVRDGEDAALVVPAGESPPVRARWVFDSRPTPPARAARTAWVQHFRGWTLRFADEVVDPDLPVLMDFSTAQPPRAVSFGYVLPLDRRRALVEYTEFSRAPLAPQQYDEALMAYVSRRWGAQTARSAHVEEVEDGAIPMTDASYTRRAGRRLFRVGTAGGATRASTGYTFSAMQRQAVAVAAALLAGEEPVPPAPYPARHRWMDAVLLRALDRGHAGGADLLVRLFDRNPPERVLRFLDGATSPREDLALMSTSPVPAMTVATVGDAAARLRARVQSLTSAGREV